MPYAVGACRSSAPASDLGTGADSGKGATYAWNGVKNVGSGSMEIMDAPAPSRVTIKLDFTKPFEAHNIADFRLEPAPATRILDPSGNTAGSALD